MAAAFWQRRTEVRRVVFLCERKSKCRFIRRVAYCLHNPVGTAISRMRRRRIVPLFPSWVSTRAPAARRSPTPSSVTRKSKALGLMLLKSRSRCFSHLAVKTRNGTSSTWSSRTPLASALPILKPEARLKSGRHVEEMRTIAWWVRKKGFAKSVRLLTEADIDRVALHNANINTAMRDTDPEAAQAARAVASGLRGAVPLNQLTQQVGLAERGYRALLQLVSAGELAPLHSEQITPETLVEWKGDRQ